MFRSVPLHDILRAVNGAASHRRVAAGLGTYVRTPTSAGSATPLLLLSRGGIRRDLVVLRRYPAPFPQGIPARVGQESQNCPIVPTWGRSCHGSRDEVSRHHENRRFSNDLGWVGKRAEWAKNVPTLTRFTPVPRTRSVLVCERDASRLVNAVNGGILSLAKDSPGDVGVYDFPPNPVLPLLLNFRKLPASVNITGDCSGSAGG